MPRSVENDNTQDAPPRLLPPAPVAGPLTIEPASSAQDAPAPASDPAPTLAPASGPPQSPSLPLFSRAHNPPCNFCGDGSHTMLTCGLLNRATNADLSCPLCHHTGHLLGECEDFKTVSALEALKWRPPKSAATLSIGWAMGRVKLSSQDGEDLKPQGGWRDFFSRKEHKDNAPKKNANGKRPHN